MITLLYGLGICFSVGAVSLALAVFVGRAIKLGDERLADAPSVPQSERSA